MNLILDTCAASEWVKAQPNPGWMQWVARVPEPCLFLSSISIAEIRFGAERQAPGHQRARLEHWLASLPDRFGERLLPVDIAVANSWGVLVARRAVAGRPISPFDALIAATAQVHSLAVVTRDVDDFRGCGVAVVNPWS